jgi:hypothetical protein
VSFIVTVEKVHAGQGTVTNSHKQAQQAAKRPPHVENVKKTNLQSRLASIQN